MTEYVTLMGAEQVQSAGNRMAAAADEMRRAASYIDDTMVRHQRFLDDWLSRFEEAMGGNHGHAATAPAAPQGQDQAGGDRVRDAGVGPRDDGAGGEGSRPVGEAPTQGSQERGDAGEVEADDAYRRRIVRVMNWRIERPATHDEGSGADLSTRLLTGADLDKVGLYFDVPRRGVDAAAEPPAT